MRRVACTGCFCLNTHVDPILEDERKLMMRTSRNLLLLMSILCSISVAACNGSGTDSATDGDTEETPRYFRFAVLADTHIIDDFYEGPEGSEIDTQTIFLTRQRLASVRDYINLLDPAMEAVFIAGDYVHNYPSDQWDFYTENTTRFDIAKQITDEFAMPVYPGMGNHDYDIPDISIDFTNRLFKEKYGLDPYYYVDIHGWRFIHINNFLGETMNPLSENYNRDMGSFGRQQLEWLDDVLAEGKPSFIFLHYPLPLIIREEFADISIQQLLLKYQETVQMIVAGHLHMWIDFGYDYGPLHWVMGSTRYDTNAYLLIEADTELNSFTVLNEACIEWFDSEIPAYDPVRGCIEE